MIKKVIICIESPFNKRDYKRFGIEVLKQNGFAVEVWDLTRVFYPELDLTPREPFEFPGLRIFKEKNAVRKTVLRLTSEDMIITWFDYLYFKFYWLYRAISKSRASYSAMQVNAPVGFCGIREPVYSKLKRVFGRIPLKVCFRILRDNLYKRIPYKFLGIKPAIYRFSGTDISLGHYYFPSDKTTRIVFMHTFDYDLYLEKNNENEVKIPENAVFLDSYLPFHEDDYMVGALHWVTADNYYPNLCRFFDYVEKEQNIKVEIAAHPRSFYEKHPDYFNKRTLRMGKTIESVRGIKFVISHDSNALNFAVIYQKPIIFIITEEMVRNNVAGMVYNVASWFGKEPINIDKPLYVDWEKELKVDKERYEKFLITFIKKKGTENITSWQIVANKLKEL